MRIVIMGGGSATFGGAVVSDILADPDLRGARLVLMDVGPGALDRAARGAFRVPASEDKREGEHDAREGSA